MWILAWLCLLCFHCAAFSQEALQSKAGVLIFCDDPSVQEAVSSAVQAFNQRLSVGYMLALFQINSAWKSENGSDSVYWLEFSTRRSNCAAGSGKAWSDCDYLPSGRQEALPCNATVHVSETKTDTKHVECLLDDLVVPDKAKCLGCPVEIDETAEELRAPLLVSISKYNSLSDSTHLFTLNQVALATRQVVAGFRYRLRFDLRKTTCAKAEHTDLNELCLFNEEEEFVNCNSTVDSAPWRAELPEIHVECKQGALPVRIGRRRPAGWSPLRNLLHIAPTTASPSAASSPPLSKAPAKEESSEEDSTASKPGSPNAGNSNPFHCPSTPWKLLQSVVPSQPSSVQPPVDGAFSDADLVS